MPITIQAPTANASLQVNDLILITAYNVTNAMLADPNFSIPSEDFIAIGRASAINNGVITIQQETVNALPGGAPIPVKPAVAFVKSNNTVGAKGYYLEAFFEEQENANNLKRFLYSVNTRATESSK